MKSISMKKLLAFLVVALLVVSMSSVCLAIGGGSDIGSMYASGDAGTAGQGVQNITSRVLGIMQIIAMAVAVVILVVLAIKYISAAPSEKADIKKSAVVYIIGVVLLFAGAGILRLIQSFAEDVNDEFAVVAYEQQVK